MRFPAPFSTISVSLRVPSHLRFPSSRASSFSQSVLFWGKSLLGLSLLGLVFLASRAVEETGQPLVAGHIPVFGVPAGKL